MLKNYMEVIVDEILPDVVKNQKLECTCEICINDIKAITLNNLTPMYVASKEGILYSKLNGLSTQFKADIIRELTISILKVNKNPHH